VVGTAQLRELAVTDRLRAHPPVSGPKEADIRAALNSAPTIDALREVSIPRQAVPTITAQALRDTYDDFPVDYNFTRTRPAANVLEVQDLEQMKRLLRNFYRVAAGIQYLSTESEHERALKLAHVCEQAKAAMQIGAKGVSFGIKLAWHGGIDGDRLWYQLYARPVQLQTTRLGLAAIAAAPERLSKSDILSLKAMGYSGVSEVAERIARYNQWGLPPRLPTPGSIRVSVPRLGNPRPVQLLQ